MGRGFHASGLGDRGAHVHVLVHAVHFCADTRQAFGSHRPPAGAPDQHCGRGHLLSASSRYGSGLDEGHHALLVFFISRAFAGLCGANISVAQAYIADITPPAQRSKKMGLIGMAFGLGFIFGPPLGGSARRICLGPAGPGEIAARLCAANFILAFFILPESWKPSSEHVAQRPHQDQWAHTLGRPKIGLLISVFFLATFCFTCFESTLGSADLAKSSPSTPRKRVRASRFARYLFVCAGVVGALVQGGATGRLVKALGEPKLIAVSLILVAVSLGPLPFANTWLVISVAAGIAGHRFQHDAPAGVRHDLQSDRSA